MKTSVLLPHVQCKSENMKEMENGNDVTAAQADQDILLHGGHWVTKNASGFSPKTSEKSH